MPPKPIRFMRTASSICRVLLTDLSILLLTGCMVTSAAQSLETASGLSNQTSAPTQATERVTDAETSRDSQTTPTVEITTTLELSRPPLPAKPSGPDPSPATESTSTPSPEPTENTSKAPTRTATKAPTSTPKPYTSPYYLYAEKGSFTLVAYQKGSDGKFSKIARIMRMAIGRGSMTPSGKFTLTTREVWHTFGPTTYGQYATKYAGRLYIHGPCYFTKNIHDLNPDYYTTIGTKNTSGCLRLTSGDAYWVFKNCPSGTMVEIVSGTPRGFTAPPLPPIVVEGEDPTDPKLQQTQATTITETTFIPPSESTTATPTESSTAESTANTTETSTADPTESTTADPTESSTADPTESSTADPTESSTADPTESSTESSTAKETTDEAG